MFTVATSDNIDHEDHSTPSVANSNYGTAMTPFQINKILQQKEKILSQNQWNSVLAAAGHNSLKSTYFMTWGNKMIAIADNIPLILSELGSLLMSMA